MVHGGNWVAGSPASYERWGSYLAQRGHQAIAVRYDLAVDGRPNIDSVTASIDAAIVELDRRGDGVVHDIVMMGDSAGAHLAALYALNGTFRDRIVGAVLVYGIYDLVAYHELCRDRGGINPVEMLMGHPPAIHGDRRYRDASPFALLAKAERPFPPSLVVWGGADEMVPTVQSQRFVAALRRAGVPVTEVEVPDEGHFWFTVRKDGTGGRLDEEPIVGLLEPVMSVVAGPS